MTLYFPVTYTHICHMVSSLEVLSLKLEKQDIIIIIIIIIKFH
jgi:hypothetical protein